MVFASDNDENKGTNVNSGVKIRKITDGFQKPSFRDRTVAQMETEIVPPPTFSSLLAESVGGKLGQYFGHSDLLAVTVTSKKFKDFFSGKIYTVKTPANAFMFARRFYHICVRFQHIQLIQTCKSVGENGVKEIAETLRLGVCPNLTSLVLGGSTVGEGGMSELSAALASGNCSKLTTLDLGVNFLGDSGVRQLAASLSCHVCPKLANLTLTFSYLGGGCVAELCSALANSCCPELTALNIQFNELDDSGFSIFCAALGKGKEFLPTLTDLTLGKEINESSVKHLCRALASRPAPALPSLCSFSSKRRKNRKLSHDMRVDMDGLASPATTAMPAPAPVLSASSALQTLHLQDNPLGDLGLRELCGALEGVACRRIRELGLANTQLGTSGMKALCQVLSKGLLPQLEELGLANNDVGASSLQLLQRALSVKVSEQTMAEREHGEGEMDARGTGSGRGGRKRSSGMAGSMQNISIDDNWEAFVCAQLHKVHLGGESYRLLVFFELYSYVYSIAGAQVSEMAIRNFVTSLASGPCPNLKLV
jgi:Ran GTPase-activating protein (RanGAP) involved in mRNA processing and transport